MQLRRLAGGQRGCAAHRLFGPFGVASAQLRQRADVGDRIVQYLVRLGVAIVGRGRRWVRDFRQPHRRAAGETDRRRRTHMSRRRHRGDLRGIEDVGAGGSGARTARRHVGQHRHLAGEHGGDDLPHRVRQPPGGIQAQHDRRRAVGHRTLQGVVEIFRHRRADGTIQRELRHHAGGCRVIGERRRHSGTRHARRQHAEDNGPRYPQPARHHNALAITSA